MAIHGYQMPFLKINPYVAYLAPVLTLNMKIFHARDALHSWPPGSVLAARPAGWGSSLFEFFFLSVFFFVIFFKNWSQEHKNIVYEHFFKQKNPSIAHKLLAKLTPKAWHQEAQKNNRTKHGSTVGKTFARSSDGCGSRLPFCSFFLFHACAVRGQSMRTGFLELIILVPHELWYLKV